MELLRKRTLSLLDLIESLKNLNAASLVKLPWYSICAMVLASGVLSSPHCIAMCGPLLYSSAKDRIGFALYHLGRLISYFILFFIFYSFGQHILHSTYAFYFQLGLAIVLGLHFFDLWNALKLLSPIHNFMIKHSLKLSDKSKAFYFGLFSGLLPCGLLYSFLILFLIFPQFYLGSILVFVFWLSQIPIFFFSAGIWKKIESMRWLKILLFISVYFILFVRFHHDHSSHTNHSNHKNQVIDVSKDKDQTTSSQSHQGHYINSKNEQKAPENDHEQKHEHHH